MSQTAPEAARYRLLLINPKFRFKHYAAQHELAGLMGKRKVTIPLALPLLAALTPPRYEIRIIDEETDDIPWSWRPDLVGLTSLSPTAKRVYQIADTFRQLGVPVVIGGSYATFMVDEALEHADAVVAGEAEQTWGQVLDDFERGALQRVYRAAEPIEFKRSPKPRWDLVDPSNVLNLFVQASRGCPFNCEFCLVNKMFGRHMRCREIDDVIAEIEALPIKRVFFADDNLTMRKTWAKELFRRLAPLGITWFCQSSVDVADDDELLDLMAEAGCTGIIVGFESLEPGALAEARKKQNAIAEYDRAVQQIQSRGIHCLASFVIGFDADTLESFDHIVDFVERNHIAWPMLSLLAIAPGTDLHARMQAEGRHYGADPNLISGMFPHVHYMNMSQLDLMENYRATIVKMLDFETAGERTLRLARTGWFARPASAGIPGREKLLTSVEVLRRFLLTSNRTRRRIFLELVKLVREKVLSPDRMVLMLLNIEAGAVYLERSEHDYQRIRRRIAAVDRGPFSAQVERQKAR
jgi:hypothetical protein